MSDNEAQWHTVRRDRVTECPNCGHVITKTERHQVLRIDYTEEEKREMRETAEELREYARKRAEWDPDYRKPLRKWPEPPEDETNDEYLDGR